MSKASLNTLGRAVGFSCLVLAVCAPQLAKLQSLIEGAQRESLKCFVDPCCSYQAVVKFCVAKQQPLWSAALNIYECDFTSV